LKFIVTVVAKSRSRWRVGESGSLFTFLSGLIEESFSSNCPDKEVSQIVPDSTDLDPE
jgi:hypothetical protein